MEKKVVIVGTIMAISTDRPWYYKGCNHCKSKIEQKFVTYEKGDGSCDILDKKANNTCGGKDVFEVTRFKIPIMVQDCSGIVSLTLFDYEGFKLLGKSVLNAGEIPPPFPKEFKQLIGKKFAFQIKLMQYNIAYQTENYGISLLSNDDGIVSGLYKKWKIEQYEQSYSSGCASLSDFQANILEVTKDSVSLT